MKTHIRPHEDQNTWNFIFSLLFLAILAVSVWYVGIVRGFPHSIPVFDALILIGASFRITRLIVYDKITRFFREWFVDKKVITHDSKQWVEIMPIIRGIRGTIHDLLGCPWCIGIWSSLVATFFYFVFPWAWYLILFLALAGASSLIQIIANLIGWKAEALKQQVIAGEIKIEVLESVDKKV
jgi:hypothetical protein